MLFFVCWIIIQHIPLSIETVERKKSGDTSSEEENEDYGQYEDTFAPSQPQPSMLHTVAPVEPQPMYQTQDLSMQEHDQGTVALDDTYAEESYDYGQYEEGAYDDGSGMIDPNSDMPLAGAGADGNKGKERKWQYKVTVTVQSTFLFLKHIFDL